MASDQITNLHIRGVDLKALHWFLAWQCRSPWQGTSQWRTPWRTHNYSISSGGAAAQPATCRKSAKYDLLVQTGHFNLSRQRRLILKQIFYRVLLRAGRKHSCFGRWLWSPIICISAHQSPSSRLIPSPNDDKWPVTIPVCRFNLCFQPQGSLQHRVFTRGQSNLAKVTWLRATFLCCDPI